MTADPIRMAGAPSSTWSQVRASRRAQQPVDDLATGVVARQRRRQHERRQRRVERADRDPHQQQRPGEQPPASAPRGDREHQSTSAAAPANAQTRQRPDGRPASPARSPAPPPATPPTTRPGRPDRPAGCGTAPAARRPRFPARRRPAARPAPAAAAPTRPPRPARSGAARPAGGRAPADLAERQRRRADQQRRRQRASVAADQHGRSARRAMAGRRRREQAGLSCGAGGRPRPSVRPPRDAASKTLARGERGDQRPAGGGPTAPPSARRKASWPSVGLLTREVLRPTRRSCRDAAPLPFPDRRRVGSREGPPPTVAGPRRRSTGFPFMPVGTEGTIQLSASRCWRARAPASTTFEAWLSRTPVSLRAASRAWRRRPCRSSAERQAGGGRLVDDHGRVRVKLQRGGGHHRRSAAPRPCAPPRPPSPRPAPPGRSGAPQDGRDAHGQRVARHRVGAEDAWWRPGSRRPASSGGCATPARTSVR